MHIPFPNVYKFASLNINSLSALAEGKAWFSKPVDFNDPFEGKFNIRLPDLSNESEREMFFLHEATKLPFNAINEPAINIIRRNYHNSPERWQEFLVEAIQGLRDSFYKDYLSIGAYSLASDLPDINMNQVSNAMMWSHYADGMKGFCIKFDSNKLFKSLNELNDSVFYWAKVDYQDSLYVVDYYDIIDESKNSAIKAIQTKHSGWQYEYECRFLTNESGLYKYSHDAIDCIYIGDKIPKSHEKLLLDICSINLPDVKIFGVRTHKSGYGVELGRYIRNAHQV